MASLKSTQGYLELYHKSKKWKSYFFKITGSTYFHYFKRNDMSKARNQVFLMAIKDVTIPGSPPKGGTFVFEVKFNGKEGSWILNAPSEVERIKWMEALFPGCTAKLGKPTRPSSLPGKVLDRKYHTMHNIYSSTPATGSVSPISPQENFKFDPVSSDNPRCATLPSRIRKTPQHPQTPSVYSQQRTSSVYLQQPSNTSGHATMTSYVTTTTSQYSLPSSVYPQQPSNTYGRATMTPYVNMTTSLPSSVHPQQMPNTSQLPYSCTSSLPQSVNRLSLQDRNSPDYENVKCYLSPDSSHDDDDIDEDGYTDMSCLSLSPPMACSKNSQKLDDTMMDQRFSSSQVEALTQIMQKLQTNETRHSNSTMSPTMTKHEQPNLDYLMQQTSKSSRVASAPMLTKVAHEEKSLTSSTEFFDHRIPKSCLFNAVSIGSGNFGDVFRATYIPKGGEAINVAIKTIKSDQYSEAHKKEMLREFSVMASMIHPNIVQLYGVVIEDVPTPWIVLEFLPYGDLKSYLKKNPQKPVGTLIKYMVDIAMGMHYLAQCGLIHRDLAARNVLVGEGELCKVSDFGLLREITIDTGIYQSQTNLPLPIRWMPPETITERTFSVASDVWSFGILIWEMFNPYSVPYSGMDNNQVVLEVCKGYRLSLPQWCPPAVAKVMTACWHKDPKMRPSFLLITSLLTTKVHATSPK